jgi:ABC-type branched-subunit amino acid transport system permease subunit
VRRAAIAELGGIKSFKPSLLINIVVLVVATVYLAAILTADSEWALIGLSTAGIVLVLVAIKMRVVSTLRENYRQNEKLIDLLSVAVVIALAAYFYDDTFALYLLTTVLVYIIACLGLNLQFGYAGILNFSGAAMLGVGGYVAAVLGNVAVVPRVLLLPIGGIAAAFVGSVLLPPMLRTRGHYSAVVTIAFNLLFVTFLDVFGAFGGSQGLPVHGMSLFGFSFNDDWQVRGIDISFYENYFALAFITTIAVIVIVRRVERSWIGLSLDSVRLDETSSKCFGISLTLWKATAFIGGNFIIGIAGAFYASMVGYIAPANFTFGDSLILVTIIVLGGLGSIWGTVFTAAIVIILPQKLQVIQEYRFLIYSIVVIGVLLFRPDGLLPRAPRVYFSGWRP